MYRICGKHSVPELPLTHIKIKCFFPFHDIRHVESAFQMPLSKLISIYVTSNRNPYFIFLHFQCRLIVSFLFLVVCCLFLPPTIFCPSIYIYLSRYIISYHIIYIYIFLLYSDIHLANIFISMCHTVEVKAPVRSQGQQ